MQNKLVENWLISAKEISFTAPFVQLLVREGYTVLQAKGGPTEQGKDIIAKDKDGNICCFQLKCGNIGSSEWQAIRAQLDDLTEISPFHPAISNKLKKWKCFLVTNGEISGQVSRNITDYSNAKAGQGKMRLETVSKDELLLRFSNCFGEFFPVEPTEIKVFFELFCESGDNTLKRKEFKQFFERFLKATDAKKSKQKKLEAIQGTLILANYLLTNKYSDENYVAILDAWVLVLLTILYYANKWDLSPKKYKVSEEIILDEIDRLLVQISNDISSNEHFLVDGTYGIFSEPFIIYKLRCAELLGYVTGGLNYTRLSERSTPTVTPEFAEKIKLLMKNKMLISEGAMPFHYNTILVSALGNAPQNVITELGGMIVGVLDAHDDDNGGLASPYYSTTEVIANIVGEGDPIKESFQGRSYTLWPAVLLLAKYGQRDLLNANWRGISQISMEEVVARSQNDLLLWDVKDSDLIDNFPNPRQSWAALQTEANRSYDAELPDILLTRKYLIPLMILAMPHRLTPRLIMSLVNN